MSNKMRKRLWPASLVMAVAIIGVVAASLMVASSPTNTQAHDGATGDAHCEGLNDFVQDLHDAGADGHTCDNPPQEVPPTLGNGGSTNVNATKPSAPAMMSISHGPPTTRRAPCCRATGSS